jgi:glycosyltransferase involved in cell wall biosynthesis
MVERIWGCQADYLCEVGTQTSHLAAVKNYDGARRLRLVWSGFHVGRKAVVILLEALARVGLSPGAELVLLGDGPEQKRWQKMAGRLGLADRIRWTGAMPREQAMAEMARGDVFVFPSIQEASSTVVLEAISLGLPVICHDACGMGLVVNDQCGIKIPLVDPRTSIDGFARAIEKLIHHPEMVSRLSLGALQQAEKYSWDRKAEEILKVYDDILAPSGVSDHRLLTKRCNHDSSAVSAS